MGQRLGQHFLASKPILEKIANAACGDHCPLLIEIGPGRGALTALLAPRTESMVAIELDPPLVDYIRFYYPSVEVIHSDVLNVDLSQWGTCNIVGNLPYYITSPIIDRIAALGSVCQKAILMMQKEVALRLVAKPGSKDYGYLSVITQVRMQTKYLFSVPRGAFKPPPKVESAVVELKPLEQKPPHGFIEFAGVCFRQKRKMLRNNLGSLYPDIHNQPEATLRAEQLTIEQLIALHSRLVS